MTTEAIWNEFGSGLFGFIKGRVNNHENAEDIFQDVFIKIHQKTGQLKEEDKLSSWVYQITRNAIIDFYRKNKLPVSDALVEDIDPEDEENLNPQFMNCMRPLVNELSPKYRDALNKTVFGAMSQKDYAKELGLSYTAAKSRVQRAKKKLKELFTDCCNIVTDSYGNIISSRLKECTC